MKKYSLIVDIKKKVVLFAVLMVFFVFSVAPISYATVRDTSDEAQRLELDSSLDTIDTLLPDTYLKADEGQELIRFDELSYGEQSKLEIGKQKLLDGGISQNFIDVMSSESIEELSTSAYAVKSAVYFVEEVNDYGTSDLKKIDKEEYEANRERSIQSLLDQIEIVDSEGNPVLLF